MESYDNTEKTDAINSSNEEDNGGDYIININDIKIEKKTNNSLTRLKSIPYICYLDILVFTTTIVMTIAFIITKYKYIQNYEIDIEPYLKPKTLDHGYKRIRFKNGITMVVGQIHFNDTAGGGIAFDKGYLNNEYKPGYLNLALTNLIYNLKYNKEGDAFIHLNNYLGNIKYSSDEDFSSFYFSILNNGFLKYLKYFSELLYLEDEDIRLKNDYIKNSTREFPDSGKNKVDKENHLLEFLIYGCKDKNGMEILPQGKKEELEKKLGNNFEEIKDIMRSLLSITSKIKLLFFSHHKFSIVKKTILKYFKIASKNKEEDKNKYDENVLKDFDTNKIIYYEIDDDENNYIKINYYINNININEKKQFFIDSKFFNYIKDILQETKKGSLYDELINSNFNMSIKSISCHFDVILKSKIIFSIKIELNHQSNDYIKDIIKIIYEYIERIRKYINNLIKEDERVNEIYHVLNQNFHYAEDHDNGDDFSYKTKKLFFLDDRFYFLKDDWFPYKFIDNLSKVKKYFNQLTLNNSVIILGINNYTKNIFNLNKSDISFIFDNINSTKYFNLRYSYNDLSKLNLTLNQTKNNSIGFTKNIYISKYVNESELEIHEEDGKIFFSTQTEKICSINSDTYRFFYFRDTSFKIPKVYISLYILHPFSRPNLTESENDNLYFQLILYISYLKDEINYRLADAKRAGSEFKIDFSENYIYIDIFCFSDIVYEILKTIEKIISDSNTKIENNFKIYRDYALETLYSKGKKIDDILKLEFYKYVYDELPFYNYYKFPIDKFINKQEIEFITTLSSSIIQVYIYGYISKDESLKICNIFEKSTKETFSKALEKANLNNGKVSIENFVEKLINRKEIQRNITNEDYNEAIGNNNYFYKRISTFNHISNVFSKIIEDIFEDINNNISVKLMTQKHIHLKIICKKGDCTKENILKRVINEIDKSGLNKKVDLIGDRFYYYLRSTQNMVVEKHESLKIASMQKIYENLYNRFNKSEKKDYFDIDFETFKRNIFDLNQEFPNYIEFK